VGVSGESIAALRREHARKGISDAEFREKLLKQVDKKVELAGRFAARVRP
jgi:hypothetical protein